MNPFEIAWFVLKAPIDWDSYTENQDEGQKIINVDYVNPKDSNKIYPITAWDYDDPFSPGIDAVVSNPKGENVGHANLRYEDDKITVDRANVNQINRRQGINTAMYQLLEHLLQEKFNRQIEPSIHQSEDAKQFWESDWRNKK
jgi:hypothetical protein